MLFNSFDFAIFLPLVFLLYWFLFNRNIAARNIFLLVVSYIFYGFWDWRFLPLIAFSSLIDYILGLQLHKAEDRKKRKGLLVVSFIVNLGILGYFKYCNFFIESFIDTFSLFGREFNYTPLNIILPVGISFYTFQSLSYTIDIYYKKIEPTKNIINFFAFVSFFPQLVAGPIERAKNLLPQFETKKVFDYQDARSGLLLILFGLFKKIVVADRLAIFIDSVYGDVTAVQGVALIYAVIFFAFQLYLDFSAYSDIAIGSARILGFRLSLNFRRPYLSWSFSEFWKRWHISLSSWFRDYVYIPLGGSRKTPNRTIVNVLVVFFLSGLWHGASWNFVIWGVINAVFLIVFDKVLRLEKTTGIKRILAVLFVVSCWAFSLIFFRVHSFREAIYVFGNLGFSGSDLLYQFGLGRTEFRFSVILIAAIMIYELIMEKYEDKLKDWFYSVNFIFRWVLYLLLALCIVYLGIYGTFTDNSFIYFQF